MEPVSSHLCCAFPSICQWQSWLLSWLQDAIMLTCHQVSMFRNLPANPSLCLFGLDGVRSTPDRTIDGIVGISWGLSHTAYSIAAYSQVKIIPVSWGQGPETCNKPGVNRKRGGSHWEGRATRVTLVSPESFQLGLATLESKLFKNKKNKILCCYPVVKCVSRMNNVTSHLIKKSLTTSNSQYS